MKTLGSIVTYKKGKPPKTGPHGRLPILSPHYLRTGRIEEMAEPTSKDVVLKGGEIILLWDGSNAGEFFRARAGILSSTMVAFEFDQEETNPDYLYYDLKRFEPELKGRTAGSGIPHVDKELLLARGIFDGGPDEQKAVAKVLLMIDRAIEQTEALLAKQQRIKTGLMHDLLTRGLDHQGHLRDPLTHPFKPSPLGLIPKEWDLIRVDNAGSVTLGRQRAPIHEKGEYLYPYLRVANVFDGWIDYSDVLLMNFTPKEQSTFALFPGDILLNEGQSLELVGRSAIFEGPPNTFCFQNTLIRFRCNSTTLPRFCQSVFKYWLDLGRFQLVAKQTTSVAHLGADRFSAMPFPRPHPDEQELIGERLASASNSIAVVVGQLLKLRRIKSGLMHDLLTGRVPVTPLLTSSNTVVSP